MTFRKSVLVLTAGLFAALLLAAAPADAKRAKYLNDDQLTMLFSGAKVEAFVQTPCRGYPTGGTLTLTVYTGASRGLMLLALVDVDGVPMYIRILTTRFDAGGVFSLSGPAPPALAGHTLTFEAAGINPTGKASLTNREVVRF